MAFQKSVNVTQAPGVEGQFASNNPRNSVPSVPGGFVAGAGGVTIGRFAWADAATGTILLNTGTGLPTGFVHNALEGLNFAYFTTPDATTMTIPQGFGVGELFSGGDFWVRNHSVGAAAVGMKAMASTTDGTVQFAAAGSPPAGTVETKWWCLSAGAANELVKMGNVPLG